VLEHSHLRLSGDEINSLTVSVVIPAYNEEATIADVVVRVRKVDPSFEIVVVNDGSSDRTAECALDAGAEVVSHPYPIGNGAAIKAGIRASTGRILVFLDADGQHPPEEIPKLLDKLRECDMAVGARTKDSSVSRFRTFGNWGLIKVANYLTGISIPDLTSGFRAIKRERVLEFVHLFPNTFSYPTTITLALLKSGYPVGWVPLDSISARSLGHSKVKPLQDGLRFIHIMVRLVMLFDPQRIFLPSSVLFMTVGVGLVINNLVLSGGIQQSSMLFIIVGVFIFFFGLLADQVAHIRREISRK